MKSLPSKATGAESRSNQVDDFISVSPHCGAGNGRCARVKKQAGQAAHPLWKTANLSAYNMALLAKIRAKPGQRAKGEILSTASAGSIALMPEPADGCRTNVSASRLAARTSKSGITVDPRYRWRSTRKTALLDQTMNRWPQRQAVFVLVIFVDDEEWYQQCRNNAS